MKKNWRPLLRAIRRPLDRVVEQADAISERRFITLDVPRIPELKAMVQALNSMVIRLKHMFAEEAARIQALQQQANGDPLTGLANRAGLDSRLEAALSEEDAASHGALLWLHLHELQAINNALGHERCDALLRDMADGWRTALADHHERVAARPAGGEFLLLAPGLDAAGARALGDAVVEEAVYQGSFVRIALRHAGGERLLAKTDPRALPGGTVPAPGTAVALSVLAHGVVPLED